MADSEFNTCLKMFCKIAFFGVLAVFVGIIFGDMNNSTIENNHSKSDNKPGENRPTTYSGNMPNSTLTVVNMAVSMLCAKFNFSGNTPKVLENVKLFFECLSPILDIETLKNEITEAAQPNSNTTKLDGIFGKYCVSVSELKVCIHGVLLGLMPCTPVMMRQYEYMVEDAAHSMLDWACSDNGTRVERFFNEGGTGCIEEQIPEAMGCLEGNSSISSNFTIDNNVTSDLSLTERCTILDTMFACSIDKLETCESNITAEIVMSVFNYIRDVSPCSNITINVGEDWGSDPNTFNYTEDEVTTEVYVMSKEL